MPTETSGTESSTAKRRNAKAKVQWPIVWSVIIGVGSLAAVASMFAVVKEWIRSEVDRKVSDDATLQKLSKLVRPYCIIDEQGRVLFDSGGFEILESVTPVVAKSKEEEEKYGVLPYRIVVRPKRFLAYPPLITVLDPFSLDVKTERGPKFDWIYSLSYVGESVDPDFTKCRYRIEILY